jgi:hypothetical protein
MNAEQVIKLAAKHAGDNASAQLCLADAVSLKARGTADGDRYAKNRALDSLKYSVGIFHPDYRSANQ